MASHSSVEKNGGYKYDLDFVDSIHERFICSICTKVMKDPHLVVCCGQKYCAHCLQAWLTAKPTPICPHCRAKGRNFQHVVEKGMKSEIESFQVQCSYHRAGCKWTGELRNLDKHLKSDDGCEFYEVVCPNKCQEGSKIGSTLVQRGKLKDHLKNICVLRKIKCEFCSKFITMQNYRSHQNVCTMFPMECPNQCGEKGIVRQTVDTHRQSCKYELISCTYAYAGCKVKIKRQDLDGHIANNQGLHLKIMAAEYDRLKLEKEEMQLTVQKELQFAQYNNNGGNGWFLSLQTQLLTSRNLNRLDLHFRMLDLEQIQRREKDWSSPNFHFIKHTLKLQVTGELDDSLLLQLCEEKPAQNDETQSTTEKDSISISLVKKRPVMRVQGNIFEYIQPSPDYRRRRHGGLTTVDYKFNTASETSLMPKRGCVLQSWNTRPFDEWLHTYEENDSLVWSITSS